MAEQATQTSFLAYHQPALQAGAFIIEQEMLLGPGLSDKNAEIPKARQHFIVSGERFVLTPDHVFATFPPKDSEGNYTGCLPHIELKRSTLPWERNADKIKQGNAPGPWLALLLVSEKETEHGTVTRDTVATDDYIARYGLSREPVSVQDIAELSILKCKTDYLNQQIPAAGALSLLAHVRKVLPENKVAMTHIPEERAIIVSSRMPQAGDSYTAHLVSLEERFENGSLVSKAGPQQEEWLVSLFSWRFTAIDTENYKPDALALSKLKAIAGREGGLKELQLDKARFEKLYETLNRNLQQSGSAPLFRSSERFISYLTEESIFPGEIDTVRSAPLLQCFRYEAATLRALLNNLNAGPLSLSLPDITSASDPVANYLNFGSVPLSHHLRAGGHTVSWYRGPFVAPDAVFEDDKDKILTHQHADELVQFNKDTGLLDMSYAAAWQLGRLMFINEPKLVQQLQLWKQENNYDEILERERKEYAHLTGFIARPKNERLPEPVVHFLLQSFRFVNFPYNYLVPDSRLLPKESLRFFKIDETWLRSFMYGVISIGESISFNKSRKIVSNIREELNEQIGAIVSAKNYYPNEERAIYGILIHSDAVSGWPALQAEAYNGSRQIALLHRSYLSDNVMLCLFYGKMQQITLHLPMGASHFGFDIDEDKGNYTKTHNSGTIPVAVSPLGVVDIAALAPRLSAVASGDLAVALLHRQDMVTFDIKVE